MSPRALFACVAWFSPWLPSCGPSPIHVDGVVRESSEMRPLRNVAPNAYRDLRVLVRAAAEGAQQAATGCGVAPLEGNADRNNAVCVPADASNDAVRFVRQRLRSYGVGVARDAREPYDYEVQVVLTGVAPRQPDPMQAKAAARLTFVLGPSAASGVFHGVDRPSASAAFDSVAKDCALLDADMTTFASTSTQPMTPAFDLAGLVGDAVDNAIGCDQLARFFLEARTRYPAIAPAPSPPPPR